MILLVGLMGPGCSRKPLPRPPLHLYCGAGLRPPVAEIVEVFEQAQGVPIECDYAGSNILLSRIRLSRKGDLYIPGDVRYVRQAERENLIASSVEACYLVPVLLVASGNPEGIEGVADLARPGLRVGLGDPRACAIGQVTERILEKNGIDPARVEANVVFRSLTVNELGLQIQTGHLDATIVWEALAQAYTDEGQILPIAPDRNVISTVPIAVLRSSSNPELARVFQEFATSPQGREIWARHGYTTNPPG